MEAQKLITLIVVGLLALAIGIALIQFLLKRLKLNSKEQTMSLSYAIFTSGLFIAYGIIISKTIQLLVSTLDVLYRANKEQLAWESLKSCTIFLGSGILWFIAGYFLSSFLLNLIIGKHDAKTEIENNNYPYVLIRCFLFITFILIFNPITEKFLSFFLPVLDVGFYH